MMKKSEQDHAFDKFMNIVRRVRKECPWDREQTHQSIRHSLLEETYEVIEAIDQNDSEELRKELGDLLLHVALHSVMAEEQRVFSITDVVNGEAEKLVRRHPHVFGTATAGSADEVKANWERIKLTEGRESILDGIPRELPALLRAHRTQEKASKVGFDWKEKRDVWKKVEEELGEFKEAESGRDAGRLEEEFGDLLFSLVNYARFLRINPEQALAKTIQKFTKRFRHIEKELKAKGKKPEEASLEEMDALWNESKSRR
jgi:nucleoside triphosphate diphosphatase